MHPQSITHTMIWHGMLTVERSALIWTENTLIPHWQGKGHKVAFRLEPIVFRQHKRTHTHKARERGRECRIHIHAMVKVHYFTWPVLRLFTVLTTDLVITPLRNCYVDIFDISFCRDWCIVCTTGKHDWLLLVKFNWITFYNIIFFFAKST